MDVEMAEVFAEILDGVWSKPWLGNATTITSYGNVYGDQISMISRL
jgi:hypothetical protein